MTVGYRELSADNVEVELTTSPTKMPNGVQGLRPNAPTDYLLEVDWNIETGWDNPKLRPYGSLMLNPSASVLHYSTTCFEGMKAYRSTDGKHIRLFRPRENIKRLNDSCERICLPTLEPEAVLKLLELFVKTEERFIAPGHYIYLRPMVMGTSAGLGLGEPEQAKFLIMSSLLPKFDSRVLKLACSPHDTVRAWPGGFGYAKLGANYGPTLTTTVAARKAGYDQVLWLLGKEGLVTEAGACNFFLVVKNDEGVDEVLTCPLSTGVILPGITRKSVLDILKEKFEPEGVVVTEREFTINDIQKAASEGKVVEAFAVGTAFFVAPIGLIHKTDGSDINIPVTNDTNGGLYSSYAKQTLSSIMWGEETTHQWAHTIEL